MNKIQRLKYFVLSLAVVLSVGTFFLPAPAASAKCPSDQVALRNNKGKEVCCPKGSEKDAQTCFFQKYVNPVIKLLSAIAGVAVVGGIIWGGIQYSMSGGDSQKVSKGKSSITKALVGLVAFLLLYSFVQFVTPTPIQGSGSKGTCAASNTFLGLKPWFAYLPKDSFNNDCSIKDTVRIMPTNKEVGVLPQVVLAVIDDLVRIAALVALAFVIVGGVKYLTSEGNPERTGAAQSSIVNALIGLAVALVAAAVVSYLGRKLSS